MLIEFSVTNFRSLHKRQTFSLVKAKGDELSESNTFGVDALNKIQLLRSAAIYGPNAAGKSNLLLAIRVMRQIILKSASDQLRGDKLPLTPFLLSQESQKSPSEFEVTFIVDQIRYQYGFSATRERIHEEWLLAYPKGRIQHWFERKWDKEKKDYTWKLGNNLLGEKQLWQKSTRDNALFLSTAVQLNSRQLQPIYDWFNTALRLTDHVGWGPEFSALLCEKNEKAQIMKFLHAADLNIEDVFIEKKPFDIQSLPDNMPAYIKESIVDDFKDRQFIDIKTVHKTIEGETVKFDFDDESSGTQKLFSFAGPWIDSLEHGYVLFIDELHASLHPYLVSFLVRLFHCSETNPNNAQLVFTTHETSILNQDIFRRDQIWFCEKDKQQATSIYPLTDFRPRKGRENLELYYLSGRYGAVPHIRSLRK